MPTLGHFARAVSALALALGFGLASAQAQDKGPIRIGFLPPITGPLASPGAEMVNGFRLFWEQAGMTAGGRKIEIVTGDTTCNPDQALTQARRLVLQEKVHFMVGPLCGHEGPAVAQVSKETGVPLVMDAAGADNVTKWDRTPTVVRTAISSSQIGHPFGEYLYKELGLRNGRTFVAAQRADHEVHLLLQHDAARLGERLVGVAGGVAGDDLDLAAAGGVVRLLPEEREPVLHVLAGRGERAGERREQADADRAGLRLRCGRCGERGEGCKRSERTEQDGSHG